MKVLYAPLKTLKMSDGNRHLCDNSYQSQIKWTGFAIDFHFYLYTSHHSWFSFVLIAP